MKILRYSLCIGAGVATMVIVQAMHVHGMQRLLVAVGTAMAFSIAYIVIDIAREFWRHQ